MHTLIRLKEIFRDIFDEEDMEISEKTSRSDIEDWDSVAHIKLVLMIEEEFGIRLTTQEVSSIQTVEDFISAIEKR